MAVRRQWAVYHRRIIEIIDKCKVLELMGALRSEEDHDGFAYSPRCVGSQWSDDSFQKFPASALGKGQGTVLPGAMNSAFILHL